MAPVSLIKAELQTGNRVKVSRKEVDEAKRRAEVKKKAYEEFDKTVPDEDELPTYEDGSPMEVRMLYDTETQKYNWYALRNREGDLYEMYRLPDYETVYADANMVDTPLYRGGGVIHGSAK